MKQDRDRSLLVDCSPTTSSKTTLWTIPKCLHLYTHFFHKITILSHSSYTHWHGSGLFLTIVGFWIIVYTLPWTSCADLGLNPVAHENTDPLYVQNTNTDDYTCKNVKALLTSYSTCMCVSVHVNTYADHADPANIQGQESRMHQHLHDCLDATNPLGHCLPCGTNHLIFSSVSWCVFCFLQSKYINVSELIHVLYFLCRHASCGSSLVLDLFHIREHTHVYYKHTAMICLTLSNFQFYMCQYAYVHIYTYYVCRRCEDINITDWGVTPRKVVMFKSLLGNVWSGLFYV